MYVCMWECACLRADAHSVQKKAPERWVTGTELGSTIRALHILTSETSLQFQQLTIYSYLFKMQKQKDL